MNSTHRGRSVFRWWTPSVGEVGRQRKGLLGQVAWQIGVRWVFVTAIGVLLVGALSGYLPLQIPPPLLGAIALSLALTNGIYAWIGGRLRRGEPPHIKPRDFLLVQTATDFAILSALSYAMGTIETPIAALFLAHISLLTLHCPPRQSLTMTLVGAVFASSPVVLIRWGLLPPLSLYDSGIPARLAAHGPAVTGYVVGIFVVFVLCWYLVAQLANDLRVREWRLQDDYDKLVQIADMKVSATLRATHELKAPLAAIKSYVYTMQDGYAGELAPTVRTIVDRIGDRCDLLAERIGQIIHLANLKTLRQRELQFERRDLVALLQPELDEANVRGKAHGVHVRWSPESAPHGALMTSETELRAMLSNLLSNAVNYSLDGGEVLVSVTSGKDGVHCTIVDHGIGIPGDALAHIYEDHFRSDNAVRHRPNGSGLGMAIVAEVVRLHDAQIEVTSKLGEGTTVTVIFPPPEHFAPLTPGGPQWPESS